MAADDLFDDKGRVITPVVGNESEDGSGVYHMIVTDSDGYMMITAV